MDNHGLACVSVWQKSEVWSLMQNEAGKAPPQQAELMLALRLGIAGMLARGGAGGSEGGGNVGNGGGGGGVEGGVEGGGGGGVEGGGAGADERGGGGGCTKRMPQSAQSVPSVHGGGEGGTRHTAPALEPTQFRSFHLSCSVDQLMMAQC